MVGGKGKKETPAKKGVSMSQESIADELASMAFGKKKYDKFAGVSLSQDDGDDDKKKKKKPKAEEASDNGPDGGGMSDATTSNIDVEPDGDEAGGDEGATDETTSAEGEPPANPDSNVEPLTDNTPTDNETPEEQDEEPAVSDGPHPMMAEAIDLAHKIGLHIGEDTTEKNFIDRFIVAAKTQMAAENPDDDNQQQPMEQAPPVVSMSQHHRDRIEELEQKDFEHRVDTVFVKGVITKPIRDKILKEAKTISLSADSAPGRDTLLVKLSAWEELPANRSFSAEEIGTKIQEVALSEAGSLAKPISGPVGAEEANKVADELAARSRGEWDSKNEARIVGKK